MPDYAKGKIYKIVCNITNETYYGSTCQPISVRMGQHRCKGSTSKQIIERGDYDYSLVENYNCNNKEELHARERYWIENNDCVNKIVPNRSLAEYYQDNKERIREQHKKWRGNGGNEVEKKRKVIYREEKKEEIAKSTKEYYLKNKERQDAYKNEWKSKKVVCECGCELSRGGIYRHRRSKMHQDYLLQAQASASS